MSRVATGGNAPSDLLAFLLPPSFSAEAILLAFRLTGARLLSLEEVLRIVASATGIIFFAYLSERSRSKTAARDAARRRDSAQRAEDFVRKLGCSLRHLLRKCGGNYPRIAHRRDYLRANRQR